MIIVQARLNSKRLPGKVLMKINNKTLLEYLVESLNQIPSKLIIATYRLDSKITKLCKKKKIMCHVSVLNNVARRFKEISEKSDEKYFVRISADSPLIDYRIIKKILKNFKKNKYVFYTNRGKNFPSGQTVEILDKKFFLNNYKNFRTKNHFEHVTSYFYEKKKNKIHYFESKKNYSNIKMSVDSYEDFIKVKNLIKGLKYKHFKYNLDQLAKRW